MEDALRYLLKSSRVVNNLPGHWSNLSRVVLPGDSA